MLEDLADTILHAWSPLQIVICWKYCVTVMSAFLSLSVLAVIAVQ